MKVVGFIWRRVLAFDRLGSRFPQLIQVWLLELFLALPLTFFIGKVIDVHGAFGVPGTGERIGGVFWGALGVAIIFGILYVRSLITPRVVQGSWTPVVHADVGSVTVYGGNRAWTVTYPYLTSHPSYALLLLLTAPIPAVMLAATANQGGSTFYFRVCGIVGLAVIGCMALARVMSWYVFRFGRRQLDEQFVGSPLSPRRMSWEMAWKPVLVLVAMMYAIVCIPLGVMWAQEQRTIAALPVVTVTDTEHAGDYRRVKGTVIGRPIYWAPRGTGRGGDNYAGAGVLVALPSGGEALVLAEALAVPDFKAVMAHVHEGALTATGRIVDGVTADQRKYYGFDEGAFPAPSGAGRVMLLLSTP
ncbi:hypothetical protein MKUB_24770 [Mycobacterium kubicae]|uniref:Uncharacterized protein n=1 Tax=Mycobacterium kubicae TaxID=120959 RepID=A0AAX1JIA2_9MYCO|nr:hypothetical protein [Mycobacterium kubicae]MCV7095847.1 hypothetical protein [Mycobacterium kubicae]ORV99513.1 hypothetical protein AWC13_10235 [Mycobacterium kubicae]QNI12024.1 hypothetical protein GAN18_13155 [Mycobacterium kubicae]QPI40252.1 hypothetical protein I2456_12975 [Mycobacterium kubicae]GFG64987.1 hypothetical protein MKUB_24770 [Mycobacterium kubicae]